MLSPDLYIGAFSIEIVTSVLGLTEGSVLMIFATTIVVGSIWNVLLALYMLMIYGYQCAFRSMPPPTRS